MSTTVGVARLPTLPSVGRRRVVALGALTVLLGAACIASLGIGAVRVPPSETLGILLRRLGLVAGAAVDSQHEGVLLAIRLPRMLLGAGVGAALALSGATLQGLFRNPLADPALIGVSSGAAFAAAAVVVLADALTRTLPALLGGLLLPLAAFAGGLGASLVVYRVSTVNGRTAVTTMLLAGIAVGALASAGTGLLIFAASDAQLRTLTFWSLGSLGGATWPALAGAMPLIALAIWQLARLQRSLNVFLLGEVEAKHLGIDVERLKQRGVIFSALAVGAAVAVSGTIAFVGLVAPHLVRLLFGPDHRVVLPGSALLGATLLLAADVCARTLVAPAELPLGIVTAFLGGPFFLWLLLRTGRRMERP